RNAAARAAPAIPMQASDQDFALEHVRLRFRDEGAGQPMAFIHGWTLDLDLWDPQCEEFRHSMRTVRHDRRGFGLSSGRPSLADDVDDLAALLDHLGIARTVLVGMSQGARVALAFALQFPRTVSCIVLDGPPSYTGDPESGADEALPLAQYRELVRAGGLDTFRRAWREHPYMQLQSKSAESAELLARMLDRYPGSDLLATPTISYRPLDARALAALRVPVLIVNGQHDVKSRKHAGDQLARLLPRAERVLLPDAGHLANLDNPRAYNETIRRFLERQALAAA
ncbi:MAG: alpha/beta fold hydrolase, partial [Steroidobacterales bacterium]